MNHLNENAAEVAIREALREVIDPQSGVNIVDLGLVRRVELGPQRLRASHCVLPFWSMNMSVITPPAAVIVVDIGTVDPLERHSMVFETFARLAPGQVLEVVSDHNPEPLLEEFAAELPDRFWWQGEKGPLDLWHVLIGKPASALD